MFRYGVRALSSQGVGVEHRWPGTRSLAAARRGRRPDPATVREQLQGSVREKQGKTVVDAGERLRSN